MSRPARVRYVHPAGEDACRPGLDRLVRHEPEVRGRAEEQGAAVVAAQGTGDDVEVAGADLFEDLAALAHPDGPLAAGVGHPHRPFGVQPDPVRGAAGPELGPDTPVGQRTIRLKV